MEGATANHRTPFLQSHSVASVIAVDLCDLNPLLHHPTSSVSRKASFAKSENCAILSVYLLLFHIGEPPARPVPENTLLSSPLNSQDWGLQRNARCTWRKEL
jgi:hypothetical protein